MSSLSLTRVICSELLYSQPSRRLQRRSSDCCDNDIFVLRLRTRCIVTNCLICAFQVF